MMALATASMPGFAPICSLSDSRRACLASSSCRLGSFRAADVRLLPGVPTCPRPAFRLDRRQTTAAASGNGSSNGTFELSEHWEARVDNVRHTEKYGHVLYLRLLDGAGSVLPVYIGDFECAALVKEINKKTSTRPMTHDLMRNTLESLGFRVTKVAVNALVGNTYHARIHYTRAPGSGGPFEEVDLDARPSDAINMAVRFSAPIYVHKEVAHKMAGSMSSYEAVEESATEVVRSCKEELSLFQDPTILFKLQLQLAIAEERYDDAAELRDQIDRMLASDRCLSLVVAIETALEDQRFDEAARLRDEFKRLRNTRVKEVQDI